MKQTRKRRILGLLLSLVLVAVTLIVLTVSASAADLEWKLLTDTGYRVVDFNGKWESGTDEDGSPYMTTNGGEARGGALYI
ncbi:MAG: hypothetical protein J6D16_01695 [Clostridia bacterium]|nr:hypothetical protein [Clostridia bacterium]